MPLPLDLQMLESDARFQLMCWYLARKEFPRAIPVAHGSWDGGRDIVNFASADGDVVWQCKFTRRSLSELQRQLMESLNALQPAKPIAKWILCVSVEASGRFHDWLRETMTAFPFIRSFEVWDKTQLLARLDRHPDVLAMFFYSVWKALEERFRTEELELIGYELVPECGWSRPDPAILFYCQVGGASSDLVLDIIVRSRGTIQSLIRSLLIEIYDVKTHLRGLPGEGLLYPQHTYAVSLDGGKPHRRAVTMEPPLLVDAGKHERFRVKLTEAGYAWTGYVRLSLLYGNNQALPLPPIFLRP